MPCGLSQIAAPGIESMPSEQKAVGFRKASECLAHFLSQSAHLLRVLDNWQRLLVLVRLNARQSFQHLVALNDHEPLVSVKIREQRTPDRVCVKHSAGPDLFYDLQMQKALVGRLRVMGAQHGRILVDQEN